MERGQQVRAEQILVADVERNMLAAHGEGRLALGAAVEVPQRDVQHVHEPVEPGRHIFAPRHQMAFVVAHGGVAGHELFDRCSAVEPDHAVGVAVAAVLAVM
ncbi:hypothetical protein D3C72_1470290 [compost metagenome]